jgi:hypothetical protein
MARRAANSPRNYVSAARKTSTYLACLAWFPLGNNEERLPGGFSVGPARVLRWDSSRPGAAFPAEVLQC